jgi:hypothetical protein
VAVVVELQVQELMETPQARWQELEAREPHRPSLAHQSSMLPVVAVARVQLTLVDLVVPASAATADRLPPELTDQS